MSVSLIPVALWSLDEELLACVDFLLVSMLNLGTQLVPCSLGERSEEEAAPLDSVFAPHGEVAAMHSLVARPIFCMAAIFPSSRP